MSINKLKIYDLLCLYSGEKRMKLNPILDICLRVDYKLTQFTQVSFD